MVTLLENNNVKIINETIFIKEGNLFDVYDKNKCYIRETIGEDGTFLTFPSVYTKVNMNSHRLDYFSVVSSVQSCLRKLNTSLTPIPMTNFFLPLYR